MGNYLKVLDRQRVLALLELGWTYRRIERETGVRRETVARYSRSRQSNAANPRQVSLDCRGRMCENLGMENVTDPEGLEPNHPAVDALLNQLGQRGLDNVPCPICGAQRWTVMPDPLDLLAVSPNRGGRLQVLVLTCAHCLYVRMHFMPPYDA